VPCFRKSGCALPLHKQAALGNLQVMADWEALAEGLEFDLWANRLWLECLERKGLGDPDRPIMGHVLSAQKVWVLRCRGESLTAMPVVEASDENAAELNSQWHDVLYANRHDPVIEFRRTTGEELRLPVSVIVRHVINHGTYHRGELRGLCLSRGDDDFPETDFGRYYLEKQAAR